jgi:hypothetical protein
MAGATLTAYTRTLVELLLHPGIFFDGRFNAVSTWQASGVLFVAALFSSFCLALIGSSGAPLVTGTIGFINGIGMAAVGCTVGYLAVYIVMGSRPCLSRLWAVFALCSGTVLLIAWVPAAFLFTEPWRWTLVGIGMVRGLKINRIRAAMIVLCTFGATVLTVYAILAMLQRMVGGS